MAKNPFNYSIAAQNSKPQAKKSKACSKVLQLMDNDFSYSDALKKVLSEDKKLNRKDLEKELETYI